MSPDILNCAATGDQRDQTREARVPKPAHRQHRWERHTLRFRQDILSASNPLCMWMKREESFFDASLTIGQEFVGNQRNDSPASPSRSVTPKKLSVSPSQLSALNFLTVSPSCPSISTHRLFCSHRPTVPPISTNRSCCLLQLSPPTVRASAPSS